MGRLLLAAPVTGVWFIALCVAGPAVADDRCTNQIDYSGDPRSNAVINSIGASTGECPAPLNAGTPKSQDDMFAQMLGQSYGIYMDSETAVDMAKVGCEAPLAGVGLYDAQKGLQQRYSDYSLNTVATVMSAGVLAYCPERLP